MEQQQRKNREIDGRDEMNLAEFPIAVIGRNDKRDMLEFNGEYRDKDGTLISQNWVVRAGGGLGLPTEFAERVLVALITLTAENDFSDKRVPFTTYRVLKILGWDINKRNYRACDKAISQLAGILIESENAFYDKETSKRVTIKKGFHVIDEYHMSYDEDPFGKHVGEKGSYIVWGDVFWRSFKAGYIKKLDLDFYLGLSNPIARRLYRFLDKRMAYQNEYQLDIFALAKFLGLSSNYKYPSALKRKLKPAFDELIASGFLMVCEVIKVGKYTRCRFAKNTEKSEYQLELFDVPSTGITGIVSTDSNSVDTYEKTLWQQVLSDLEMQTQSNTYQTYVAQTELLNINNGVASIQAGVGADWLESQMERAIIYSINLFSDEKVNSVIFV